MGDAQRPPGNTSGTVTRDRPRAEESTNRRQGLRSSARLASPPNSSAYSSSSSRSSSPSPHPMDPTDPTDPMDPSAHSSASSPRPQRPQRPQHSSGPMGPSGPMASPDSFDVMAVMSEAVTSSVLHLLANQGRSVATDSIRAALKDCQLAIRVTRAIVSSDQFKAGSPEPFA